MSSEATLLNDNDLAQRLMAHGYRIATYKDMPVTTYVCKHGTIADKCDEDHPCVWTPVTRRNND